ncbi:MAG: hypothetical protein ABIB93_06210 [Chloroflexota bacterium]
MDGDMVAVRDEINDVLGEVLSRVDLSSAQVITIYYGADTGAADAEEISASIRKEHPHLQLEVVNGGQSHYNLIVSVE